METSFKNINLNLVHTFHRTPGGQSPCSSPIRRTRDQIDGFGVRFFDSLHPSTPLHLADLPSTPEPHGSNPSGRGDHRHPGSSRTVAMPCCSMLSRRPSSRPASHSAAPCPSQHHTAPPGHGNWSPPTPHARARTRPAPPELAQSTRGASPLPSSRHATPRPHFCSLASPHRSNTVAAPYGELSRPCTAPRTASTVHRPSGYKATPSPPLPPHSTPAPLPHSTLSRAPPGGRSR